jgi:hypothetical protein
MLSMRIMLSPPEMEHATEVAVTDVMLIQFPQFEIMLYLSVEQPESTEVQLNTSCSELVPTNWTIAGGGSGSNFIEYFIVAYDQ